MPVVILGTFGIKLSSFSSRIQLAARFDESLPCSAVSCLDVDDYEVVAEELSQLAERSRELEQRVADVERSTPDSRTPH